MKRTILVLLLAAALACWLLLLALQAGPIGSAAPGYQTPIPTYLVRPSYP